MPKLLVLSAWPFFLVVMASWSIYRCYNMYVQNLLFRFWCIKGIHLSCSIYFNSNDILRPKIVHDYNPREFPPRLIVNYNYLTHLYASIIIIIDVHLVLFRNGAWIVLGSNTINDHSIPLLSCRHATPSHKRARVVSSLLCLTFVAKIKGGGFSKSRMLIRSVVV